MKSVRQDAHTEATASSQPASSQPVPKNRTAAPSRAEKSKPKTKGTKRASTEDAGPKRQRKKDALDTDSADDETRGPMSKRPAAKTKGYGVASNASKGLSGNEEDEQSAVMLEKESNSTGIKPQESESEMSEVLDEAPKPKRSRKSGSVTKSTSTKSETKGKKPSDQPTDPDAEDIKRLQGWLIKCGIRKMWFKELAPYDTSKSKIRHLKEMLTDAGMTGRYSTEKASQIKEERELKADLEAVQEGAKHWGKADSEEDDGGGGRPRRRLAKGLQGLDFLNDDDGEETD